MSIWDKLKNFKKTETWGDWRRMNGSLLLLMDEITSRVKFACPGAFCVVHCGYEKSDHATKSQHYLGNAADFHFHKISPKIAYGIILLTLSDWQMTNHCGLGNYPDWANPGFHLDARGEKARWARVNGIYVAEEQGLKLLK